MLAGARHLRRNLSTALSLRPIGESLEKLAKKARSKTDGDVPAPKRVRKALK